MPGHRSRYGAGESQHSPINEEDVLRISFWEINFESTPENDCAVASISKAMDVFSDHGESTQLVHMLQDFI